MRGCYLFDLSFGELYVGSLPVSFRRRYDCWYDVSTRTWTVQVGRLELMLSLKGGPRHGNDYESPGG